MEAPRYRTIRTAALCGIAYPAGAEAPVSGWPSSDVEPMNESAKRVTAWLNRFGMHPLKPASIYNNLAGGIYLPGVLPDLGPVGIFNPHFDTPQASSVSPVR